MAAQAQTHQQLLLSILRSEGPTPPGVLSGRLGISQPTLFRSVRAQSHSIVVLGARRNSRLAANRSVRELGSHVPIFRISEAGELSQQGRLLALYPQIFAVVWESEPNKPEIFPGLPFYLDDIKPQGFLGRSFNQKHADLRLPARLLDWSNDDILGAIARRGEDLPGNLLVGAESFERYQFERAQSQAGSVPISSKDLEKRYLQLAQLAVDGEQAGSSVAGEQPKFGASVLDSNKAIRKVLVKFSPLGDSFAAQRWRDLLVSEHLALDTLRKHGIASAESRVFQAGGRCFLESTRFDRIGARGRRGVVSLGALENEWAGRGVNWAASAQILERERKISTQDFKLIQILECFGRLIGNSDRHAGNMSFFWEPGQAQAKLAPVYDMLPMLYAPSSGGEDAGRKFVLPTYEHTLLEAWKEALPLAHEYWKSLADLSTVSRAFRKIARENIKVLGA